jgi:hypothetical protein
MNFAKVELDDTELNGSNAMLEQHPHELLFSPRTIASASRLQTDTDSEFVTGSFANVLLRFVF